MMLNAVDFVVQIEPPNKKLLPAVSCFHTAEIEFHFIFWFSSRYIFVHPSDIHNSSSGTAISHRGHAKAESSHNGSIGALL